MNVQEHITEYGMHWNFFFTLGTMPLVGGLMGGLKRNLGVRFRDIGLVIVLRESGFGYRIDGIHWLTRDDWAAG